MKKLILSVLMVSVCNSTFAGVRGSIGYETQSIKTHTQIPYAICTPKCSKIYNDYYSNTNNNGLRLNLGYEQHVYGPVSIDLMAGTTPSFMDFRLESNIIYNINNNLSIKAGINRYQERSNSTFKYKPESGYQVGLEYKLPSQGELTPFVDIKYYKMNTSYEFSGSNSINNVQKDAVSIGIGLSF